MRNERLVATPALLVFSRVSFQIKVVRKSLQMTSYRGMTCQYLRNNICVSGPIFVKLANDLNPSSLSPTAIAG